MGKRWILLIVVAATILVVVGALTVWVLTSKAPSGAPPVSPPAGTPQDGDAERAAAALQKLTTDPAALLPDALDGELDGDVSDAIPEGTTLIAEPDRWRPSAAGGGVMEVTLKYPDGNTETLDVVMIEDDGRWKVLQTLPAGALR